LKTDGPALNVFRLYLACVLIVGLVAGYYWTRVLKLVVKTRRKTGQSAQLVPVEPLGRALRIIWYPAVAAWVLVPLTTAALSFAGAGLPRVMQPLFVRLPLALAGTLVALLGMWATLICWRKMGKSWRMGINPGEKTELVVSGPWAYVAHPIYALSSLIMWGTLATLPSPLMLVAGFFHLFFLQWEARREEQNLINVHGETYANYLRHVGRFLPRSAKPFQSLAS
jgi:protein-S-isoprenylcysteine O-methyltransferase Ste14